MKNKSSRLFSLPIIGSYIKRISLNIEKFGLQKAIKKEIKRSKTNCTQNN